MNYLNKVLSFIKRRKYLSTGIGLVIVIIIIISTRSSSVQTQAFEVIFGNIIQEVSVTGKIQPAESIDLQFEKSGRVIDVNALVGQEVRSGQILAQLESSSALKAVRDAEISLEGARISLEKLKLNQVNSVPKIESDIEKAEETLFKAYEDTLSTVSDAFIDLPSSLSDMKTMLFGTTIDSGNSNSNAYSNLVREQSKAQAFKLISQAQSLYQSARVAYEANVDDYISVNRTSSPEEIIKILNDTKNTVQYNSDALKSIQHVLDFVEDDIVARTNDEAEIPDTIVEYQSDIATHISTINSHLRTLINIQNTVSDSQRDLLELKRDLDFATKSNPLDIQDLENTVKQKEVALNQARIDLSDYYLISPFTGVVTRIDAKEGDLVSVGSAGVSVINDAKFEVEVNIPEADISRVKVGNDVNITTDAYGQDVIWPGKIVSLDLSETLVGGIPTYKAVIHFNDNDERIISGLTANVDIIGEKKENVLIVPQRSIIRRDGQKFVRVIVEKNSDGFSKYSQIGEIVTQDDEIIIEVPVQTGLSGSNGNIEIVSGLSQGDKVVTVFEAL